MSNQAAFFEALVDNEKCSVAFKRANIEPAYWAAFSISTRFTSFLHPSHITNMSNLTDCEIACLALIIYQKICDAWLDAIADENFEELTRLVLYPRNVVIDSSDFSKSQILSTQYQKLYQKIQSFLPA